jgi:hypothetical protein
MENNYYIYFHINLVSNEVFYVGKGKGRRAWRKFGRSQYWNRIVNKYGYRVDIIHENLSEKRAFDWEKLYISMFGRKNLCNLTDGGDGSTGCIPNEETRKKLRNKIVTEETRKKISQSQKGRIVTEQTRKKLSQSHKGNNNWLGKTHTEETKQKMRNKIVTEETRKKIKKNNGVKCEYKGEKFNSKTEVWKNYFQYITHSAFRNMVSRNKIEGLVTI